MKRLLSMLLAAAMLLTLAACSPATLKGAGTGTAAPSTQEPTDAPTETPTDAPTEAPTEAPTTEATEAPSDVSLLGAYDAESNVYISEMLSASFYPDSDWTVYGAEELADLNGISASQITEEGAAQLLKEEGSALIVFCSADVLGDSINITYEKLSAVNALMISEENYVSIVSGKLEEQLTEQGLEDVQVQTGAYQLCGKTYPAIQTSGTINGVPIQQGLACVKVGSYMVVVTVTLLRDDLQVQDVLDLFVPMEG